MSSVNPPSDAAEEDYYTAAALQLNNVPPLETIDFYMYDKRGDDGNMIRSVYQRVSLAG